MAGVRFAKSTTWRRPRQGLIHRRARRPKSACINLYYVCIVIELGTVVYDDGTTATSGLNLSDIAFINRHLLQAGPTPCEEYFDCQLPTGDNRIILGCPLEVLFPSGDSVALPVYLTTDVPISGLTIGLDCGTGDANCDGACDVGDAVYLINYVFKQGREPGCP